MDKKINWKAKLSSRRFWAAIIGIITAVLVAFNVDNLTITQVTAVISGIGGLIAFIIGESVVDAARVKGGE